MTTAGPGTSAREALQAGACSPSCLLSRQETGRCRCTCGGTYHGLLMRHISAPEQQQPAASANRTARRRQRKGRRR